MTLPDPDSPAVEPSLADMRGLVRIAVWAALIGVGGWVSLPLPPVPVSLQTFFVALAGLAEGPRRGALAAGLYLLAGLAGLPVFAGGVGGPAIFLKPSAGFALAFPLGAAVAGLASPRRRQAAGAASFFRAFLLVLLGHLVINVGGFLGLLVNTDLAPPAAAGLLLTFVPGALAKAAAAALLAGRLARRRLSGDDARPS
jgi:biotin transport system substrate-specific component